MEKGLVMAAFDTAEHARAIVRLVWRSHEALLNSKTEHKIDLLRKELQSGAFCCWGTSFEVLT